MKKKTNKKAEVSNQMLFDLFQDIAANLTLEGGNRDNLSEFEFQFRNLLKAVLDDISKRAVDPLDRNEVAARMSRKLGRDITKTHLDQWAALSTIERRIHVDALKALSEVTEDWRPLNMLVESCGFKVVSIEEGIYAEYGARMMLKRMIDTDIKETLDKADHKKLRQHMLKRLGKGE